ncbi:MAG: MFS transporter [Geminicoccaceae bacterium]
MSSLAAPGRPNATTRQMLAWATFDWASSPFFAVVITFVFATYVTTVVAPDEITGTAEWSRMTVIAAVLIALTSPVLGAIADAGGARKPWLFTFMLLSCAATACLWFVAPEHSYLMLALTLVLLANVCNEVAQAFYNAMLPDLAEHDQLGRWSGWGWGLGYIAGIVALALILVLFVQPKPPLFGLDAAAAEQVRIVGPLLAVWFLLFSLPLFLITPDRAGQARPVADSVRHGLATLVATLKDVRGNANIARFLLARLVYNDGLNTLFAFGGIYAAGTFGMTLNEVLLFGIALNVTAGLGAFGFAFLDDRIGSKPTIMIAICGLFVAGTVALLAEDKATFWIVALAIGIFVGPAQSASRTLMARLAPADQRTEMFGIYALTGKVTAFIGPFLFGTATAWFQSQRAGMATILVMFVVGGLLLMRVREPARS